MIGSPCSHKPFGVSFADGDAQPGVAVRVGIEALEGEPTDLIAGVFKVLKTSDGSMTFLITGFTTVSFTNLNTGKTITEDVTGPGTVSVFADAGADQGRCSAACGC